MLLCTDGAGPARALLGMLLERTPGEIALAAPSARRAKRLRAELAPEQAERVTAQALDLADAAAVQAAAEAAEVVVCATAPLGPVPLPLVHAALLAGAGFVDVTASRESALAVRALALELQPSGTGSAVATAFSLTAMAGALAALAAARLDGIDAVHCALVPGPGFPASRRELARLLETASRPVRVTHQGIWCTLPGWSEPAAFHFPAPLGERVGRLTDAPACELLPNLLGTLRVEWRVDEQSLASPGLKALARLRSTGRAGPGLVGAVAGARMLFGGGSAPAAGLGVEADGRYGRHPLRVRCALTDERGLERMALFPAAYVASRLAERPGELRGLVPHDRWITPQEFVSECERLGLALSVDER
jgi:hypothetical protein